jgi:hypothetical protein
VAACLCGRAQGGLLAVRLLDERAGGALEWLRGSRAGLGIQAEMDAWLAALAGNDPRAAVSPAALGLFSGVTVLLRADTFSLTGIQSRARQPHQRTPFRGLAACISAALSGSRSVLTGPRPPGAKVTRSFRQEAAFPSRPRLPSRRLRMLADGFVH